MTSEAQRIEELERRVTALEERLGEVSRRTMSSLSIGRSAPEPVTFPVVFDFEDEELIPRQRTVTVTIPMPKSWSISGPKTWLEFSDHEGARGVYEAIRAAMKEQDDV